MSEQQTDTRTASQRLEDVERGSMAAFQTMDNMVRDIMTIKEAIKLLGNKVDSIVKALEVSMPTTINDDILSKLMVENNVAELRNKVGDLVSQGILAPQEVVDDNSFLVGRELNDAGEVVNPRIQFALQALQEEMRAKIKGSKAGDVLSLEEGKLKFEVLETYSVQPPPAAASEATPVTPEVIDNSASPSDAGSANG
jgi:hypothetical protein